MPRTNKFIFTFYAWAGCYPTTNRLQPCVLWNALQHQPCVTVSHHEYHSVGKCISVIKHLKFACAKQTGSDSLMCEQIVQGTSFGRAAQLVMRLWFPVLWVWDKLRSCQGWGTNCDKVPQESRGLELIPQQWDHSASMRTEREMLEGGREILLFRLSAYSLVNQDEEANSPGGSVAVCLQRFLKPSPEAPAFAAVWFSFMVSTEHLSDLLWQILNSEYHTE